jgi:hypothetical protein
LSSAVESGDEVHAPSMVSVINCHSLFIVSPYSKPVSNRSKATG